MELKLSCRLKSSTQLYVIIVPLWNWNKEIDILALIELEVIIVPLWNWNYSVITVPDVPFTVIIVPYGIEIDSLEIKIKILQKDMMVSKQTSAKFLDKYMKEGLL